MRSLRGRVGLCVVLWAAIVASPFPCAAADGDSLTPEKLAQAIRYRNDLPENLSFHATLEWENLADKSTKKTDFKIVIAGKKYRCERVSRDEIAGEMVTDVTIHNGTLALQYTAEALDGDLYEGFPSGFRPLETVVSRVAFLPFPFDTPDLDSDGRFFPYTLLEDPRFQIVSSDVTVDGHRCVHARFRAEDYWFSKDQGYRLLKEETRLSDRNDGFLLTTTLEQIEGDFWFPVRAETRIRRKGSGELIEIRRVTITDVSMNSELDDSLFDVSAPPGHYVYDHRTGVQYVSGGVDAAIEQEIFGAAHKELASVPSPKVQETVNEIWEKEAKQALDVGERKVVADKEGARVQERWSVALVAGGLAAICLGVVLLLKLKRRGAGS